MLSGVAKVDEVEGQVMGEEVYIDLRSSCRKEHDSSDDPSCRDAENKWRSINIKLPASPAPTVPARHNSAIQATRGSDAILGCKIPQVTVDFPVADSFDLMQDW